jgi:hypothetical protein
MIFHINIESRDRSPHFYSYVYVDFIMMNRFVILALKASLFHHRSSLLFAILINYYKSNFIIHCLNHHSLIIKIYKLSNKSYGIS